MNPAFRCLVAAAFVAGTAFAAADSSGPTRPAKDSLALSLTAVPYVFYAPETRLGGGLAGGFFKRFTADSRPSSLMAMGMYTQRRQYQVGIHAEHRSPGDRNTSITDLSFREFPDRFHGIGGDTHDSLEEAFTARSVQAMAQWMGTLRGPLKAGALGLLHSQAMVETEAGGSLAAGRVPGSGDWITAGLGPQVAWDTRDAVFFPRSGSWIQFGHAWFLPWDGSGSDFQQVRLDARHYLGLGRGQVVAFQAMVDLFWGEVPFPMLAELGGGSLLRGYYQGRYRDKRLGALQAEYRFPIWKRLGGAAFAAAGKVGTDFAGLAEAEIRPAAGLGLRCRLNREGVNLRVDGAFDAERAPSLYVTFMEAF